MNLKNIFTTNMQMKFLCLFLAAILWLFVTLESNDEIDLPISVSCLNKPVGLAVKGDVFSEVTARVEGPKILLLRQKLKGVLLQLDLSGAREGVLAYRDLERSVKVVKGVRLHRVSPQIFELNLVSIK